MSNDKKDFTVCKAIENIPNLQNGWGCHLCHSFNGDQRPACKSCGHVRCFAVADDEAETNFSLN